MMPKCRFNWLCVLLIFFFCMRLESGTKLKRVKPWAPLTPWDECVKGVESVGIFSLINRVENTWNEIDNIVPGRVCLFVVILMHWNPTNRNNACRSLVMPIMLLCLSLTVNGVATALICILFVNFILKCHEALVPAHSFPGGVNVFSKSTNHQEIRNPKHRHPAHVLSSRHIWLYPYTHPQRHTCGGR